MLFSKHASQVPVLLHELVPTPSRTPSLSPIRVPSKSFVIRESRGRTELQLRPTVARPPTVTCEH